MSIAENQTIYTIKTKLKQVIFTDTRLDGTKQINKKGEKFFMLHLQIEDDKWLSKYYQNGMKPRSDFYFDVEYNIEYVQNGEWFNLISVTEIPSLQYFKDAILDYAYGFSGFEAEKQTEKLERELETCRTIEDCKFVVNKFFESNALWTIKENFWIEVNLL